MLAEWTGPALATASATCFGVALVTGRVGLRDTDAKAGAAVSIPTATLLFAAAAPFALDASGFDVRAALVFAAVGLFFPAVVTLLTFRSNELLGPTVTGAISGTSPLFALLAAGLWLGERVPGRAMLSTVGVVVGVALLSRGRRGARGMRSAPGGIDVVAGRALLWPVAGAIARGAAQVGAKAGLILWPSPFAAGLIGYLVSSAAVIGVDRLGRARRRRSTARGVAWFAATGVLNGGAVLLMYAALASAPVWTVAPLVASYPLVTAMLGAAVLRDERPSLAAATGAVVTVASIAFLVGAP